MNDDDTVTVTGADEGDDADYTTSSLYDDYSKHGVVGPIDVVSINEATEILNAFWKDTNIFPTDTTTPETLQNERHLYQYHQKNNNLFRTHLFAPYINQLIRHPTLIRAVQAVLRTKDVRCWSCDFNIRTWGTPTMIAPHQDATYAGLIPCDEVVTAWIALSDPVTIQEGGLVFYSGTHLLGQLPHTSGTINDDDDDSHVENDTELVKNVTNVRASSEWDVSSALTTATKQKLRNVLSRGQYCDIPNGIVGTSIPLRAGQATLHHFYTIHASGPNVSSNAQPRVGLAIRYISANVRKQNFKVKEMITYISGRTDIVHDCFNEEWEPILPERPTQQDIEHGKAVHAIAMERETTNYFTRS